jgi:hypothetical protein
MNVEEGARRMTRAGQWLVGVPSAIAIAIWTVTLAGGLLHPGFGILFPGAMIFGVLALYLAIGGGVLWLAGWIVEGFAQKQEP